MRHRPSRGRARPVYDPRGRRPRAFVAGGVCGTQLHRQFAARCRTRSPTALQKSDVVACAVLSGNRNFEGRIHPQVKMNFLASPPLVVAYAIAGNMKLDLYKDPLGLGKDGKPVYLKRRVAVDEGDPRADREARHLDAVQGELRERVRGRRELAGRRDAEGRDFTWDDKSTYVKNPPYFEGMSARPGTPQNIQGARVLAMLGDR